MSIGRNARIALILLSQAMSPALGLQAAAQSAPATVLPRNTDPSISDIVKVVEVPASLDSVWWAWTTVEGITSFFAPSAFIELRIGGAYELYFRKDQPPGHRGSEGVKILSFEPRRMLSFDWRAPPELPGVRNERTWMVIRLDSLGPKLTRVTMTQMGWQPGEEWRKNHEFFQKAMDEPMTNLRKRFMGASASPRP